uniref:uncharacterized protein LOC122596591 n=1 Tax=Erigeron canadensis TaxID=72917 RepID=UPI001CB9BF35|nr:uncharacterized protein LOC122596591 [Erigeron canadensis]
MVIALGPGKFYGSSLPRPRYYTDIKYNTDRVDPPVSVLDPLMSWAEEAHWSMGGLSFKRHRLQGRIEGNVEKLRNQIEKTIIKKETQIPLKKAAISKKNKGVEKGRGRSLSPPPAPKRKRKLVGLIDEEEEDEEIRGKWPIRKLSDEFDLVANKTDGVASRTRGRKVEEEVKKSVGKGKKKLRKIGEKLG